MNKTSCNGVIIISILMLCLGLFLPLPSNELTTFSFYKYYEKSQIEEYVGGDAYNYIIGANIVGAKITGFIIAKAIFIAVGVLLFCIGIINLSKIKNMEILYSKVMILDELNLKVSKLDKLNSKSENEVNIVEK